MELEFKRGDRIEFPKERTKRLSGTIEDFCTIEGSTLCAIVNIGYGKYNQYLGDAEFEDNYGQNYISMIVVAVDNMIHVHSN